MDREKEERIKYLLNRLEHRPHDKGVKYRQVELLYWQCRFRNAPLNATQRKERLSEVFDGISGDSIYQNWAPVETLLKFQDVELDDDLCDTLDKTLSGYPTVFKQVQSVSGFEVETLESPDFTKVEQPLIKDVEETSDIEEDTGSVIVISSSSEEENLQEELEGDSMQPSVTEDGSSIQGEMVEQEQPQTSRDQSQPVAPISQTQQPNRLVQALIIIGIIAIGLFVLIRFGFPFLSNVFGDGDEQLLVAAPEEEIEPSAEEITELTPTPDNKVATAQAGIEAGVLTALAQTPSSTDNSAGIDTPPSTWTTGPAPYIEDSFSPDISPEWVIDGEDYVVVDNALSASGNFSMYVGDNTWTDYKYEFQPSSVDGNVNIHQGAGFVVRRQDEDNYIALLIGDNLGACIFNWIEVVDGVPQSIPNTREYVDSMYRKCYAPWEIRVEGNSYTLFRDGSQVKSFNNNRFDSGGVGIVLSGENSSVIVDDIVVRPLESP